MPLYKRKPFSLVEVPNDLDPKELVFQIRFTKEIFRDYQEYLNRINLYRQRLWTCKISGKSNLTYEEALVSEKRAIEKVQQFPQELMAPMLSIIQFSMLPLRDLADKIALKLQECLFAGLELYGRKEAGVFLCRIIKTLHDSSGKKQYKIAWLDKDKEVVGYDLVYDEDLIKRKLPFSREMVKSFIRESTYRNAPWVLHGRLAEKHGISTHLPDELKSKFYFQNGTLISYKKNRKNGEEEMDGEDESGKNKGKKRTEREKVGASQMEERKDGLKRLEAIKYPIEDLLVQPCPDDPIFTERASPSRDFKVPMDCVGELLMIWDFCSSFSRLLHLSPFSLEDFENAVCHRESNLTLIVECHSALLRLLIKDNGEYASTIVKRKRKSKITLITWREYLCDFLDMNNSPKFRPYMATIKRGHYGLLDTHAKLEIFGELLNCALETDLIREQLDEYIGQWQKIGSTRRGEALEEAKRRREEQERLKAESELNGFPNGNGLNSSGNNVGVLVNNTHNKQNGVAESEKTDHVSKKRGSSQTDGAFRKRTKKHKGKDEHMLEDVQHISKKEAQKIALKHTETVEREEIEMSSKEQRKQHYETEMEKRFIRTNPLGKDRHHNRYWWFRRDGRIFIESLDHKMWGYYGTKEELDALMGSLNRKGERERALQTQLDKFYGKICSGLQKRLKHSADKIALEEAVLRRSTRVRAPPRDNPADAFLRYVNKWKED
ncbi:DDT domain-containing protein DDB_G0282237 isoform X3 [Rhodamnia argentea]|uniref:DDT domain-containing protein DDB_G0282237 isoform X3 n=1 Tax=Rhodamnia argentea TaxID=178133 RepID=A0ABM3GWI1_9MYRT|nr:DDT domain-containing protein DDB_G0282237 isoform X3 [Rhodamnia argentea]